MADVVEILKDLLKNAVEDIAEERDLELPETIDIFMERPKREGQGDWATNAAMKYCKLFGEAPRMLAERIAKRVEESDCLRKVEVAGPGFINFYLSKSWMKDLLEDVLSAGENYGRCDLGCGKRIQVEFVSANPTGPLHVGHGRGAAVGDIAGNILSFAGWDVQKEYYINDAGLQMSILGRSTQARYFELLGEKERAPFPEDGYKGTYIYDLARKIMEEEGNRFLSQSLEESLPFFKKYAGGVILDSIKKDLADFGVHFDNWFSEKSLYDRNLVPLAVKTLKEGDYTYEKEGAIWFRSTEFADDKDRVLIRANGVPTYFASDVAYHKEKFDRGFDEVIDVWGADHHGYVPRMKAGIRALGRNSDDFHVLLIQFVNLLRDGAQVAMSTRAGAFVTLRDVIDEVGVDATRYYFVMRRSDSHLDFDLALAKKESTDNPVYYVQYANARISSIRRKMKDRKVTMPSVESLNEELLETSEERKLLTRLSTFPEEVEKAARELAPHRIVNYAYALAGDFHSFYNAHRVLDVDTPLRDSRLLLVESTRVVLNNALRLLGISAPEKM